MPVVKCFVLSGDARLLDNSEFQRNSHQLALSLRILPLPFICCAETPFVACSRVKLLLNWKLTDERLNPLQT